MSQGLVHALAGQIERNKDVVFLAAHLNGLPEQRLDRLVEAASGQTQVVSCATR